MVRTWIQCRAFCTEISLACLQIVLIVLGCMASANLDRSIFKAFLLHPRRDLLRNFDVAGKARNLRG